MSVSFYLNNIDQHACWSQDASKAQLCLPLLTFDVLNLTILSQIVLQVHSSAEED